MASIETFQWFSGTKLRTQFGWRLIDDNGEIIAVGEGYSTKSNAKRGAQNLLDTIYEMVEAGPVEINHVA